MVATVSHTTSLATGSTDVSKIPMSSLCVSHHSDLSIEDLVGCVLDVVAEAATEDRDEAALLEKEVSEEEEAAAVKDDVMARLSQASKGQEVEEVETAVVEAQEEEAADDEEEDDDKWLDEMEKQGNFVFNKSRLIAYYSKHNPTKVETVEDTLDKYNGMEDVLFERLAKKYGENFTAPWLTDFYQEYSPDLVAKVDTTLLKYHGQEYELYRKLEAKYGPFGQEFHHDGEDSDEDEDDEDAGPVLLKKLGQTFQQKRLIAYLKRHNPSKLATVDKVLEKYAGREEQLMKKLVEKYFENPIAPLVTEFYLHYDPEKIGAKADSALEKYYGKDEELFAKLEAKYGSFDVVLSDVPTSMTVQVHKTASSTTHGPWSFGTTKAALTIRKRIAKGQNHHLFLDEPSIKPLHRSERLNGKGALFGKITSHNHILVGDLLGSSWKQMGNLNSKGKHIAPKYSEAGNPSVRAVLPHLVIDGTNGMKRNTGVYYLAVKYSNDGVGLDAEAGIIIGEIAFDNKGQALALGAPLDKIEKETYDGKSWNTWVSTRLSALPWMDGNILRFKVDTNTNTISFWDEMSCKKHVYPGALKYANQDNDIVKIFAYVGAKPATINNSSACAAEANTLTILKDDKKW